MEKAHTEGRMTRRGLLRYMAGGGALAVGMAAYARKISSYAPAAPQEEIATRLPEVEIAPIIEDETEVHFGPLAGRTVVDLYADYLGFPDGTILPETGSINFKSVMRRLWIKKRDFVRRHNPEYIANTLRGEAAFAGGYEQAHERGETRGHTLASVNESFKPIIENLHRSIRWEGLKEIPAFSRLSDSQIELVKKLSSKITSEMLLAYGITELMPSVEHATFNVDMTEFLIQNAGPQFMAAIPSVHDSIISPGMFQLTSHAVYEGPDGEKRGASLINELVTDPEQRIPGSVIRLTETRDQARAAYLFAIENLARLINSIRTAPGRGSTERRLSALNAYATLPTYDQARTFGILQYIASAHHNPAQAREGFIEYIDRSFSGSHANLCSPRISNYIRKARNIYLELSKRFRA